MLTERRWVLPLLALALTTVGCRENLPAPPRQLSVGTHRLELQLPDDWLHFDHGSEQRFEHGIRQISLSDLGPATPAAFHREVLRARALFRGGQIEDSRARLARLEPRALFDSDRRWQSFRGSWDWARRAGTRRYDDAARIELELAQREGDLAKAGELAYGVIPELEKKLEDQPLQDGADMIKEAVTEEHIAAVVSKWTGIPVDKMLEGLRKAGLGKD